ncbi:MAG: hypothetical protein VX793_00890 [Pseudomonadota bacterium]|nr:hypothetical protein [Pseudomonadota bacterium]
MKLKKAVIFVAVSSAMGLSANTMAAEIRDNAGTAVASTPVSATFRGASALTQYGVPVNCTLELDGSVDYYPAGTYPNHTGAIIEVTGGSVSGGGFCSAVVLNFSSPWTAVADNSDAPTDSPNFVDPVSLEFNNVDVTGPLGACGGSTTPVPATFRNGTSSYLDESEFTFSATIGNCTVNGTLQNVGHPGDDINVW